MKSNRVIDKSHKSVPPKTNFISFQRDTALNTGMLQCSEIMIFFKTIFNMSMCVACSKLHFGCCDEILLERELKEKEFVLVCIPKI